MEAALTALKWIVEVLLIPFLIGIVWVIRQIFTRTEETKENLATLRTHIAENYENRNSIQMSLARIHTRIDETQQNINDGQQDMTNRFDKIQETLTKILTNCASKSKC